MPPQHAPGGSGAAWYSQSEAQPLGAQPLPRGPKRAAFKVSRFSQPLTIQVAATKRCKRRGGKLLRVHDETVVAISDHLTWSSSSLQTEQLVGCQLSGVFTNASCEGGRNAGKGYSFYTCQKYTQDVCRGYDDETDSYQFSHRDLLSEVDLVMQLQVFEPWSKCPPLAVPQLAPCASSGRAWRL